jgi:demethylmenaquinone methyltransferase/2-methoxy-6-polyprenyl-1,4-benzoquinol methylase
MDSRNYNVVQGFNTIAPAYDLANDAMTMGLHRLWRRRLCEAAIKDLPRGAKVLDVATGTGDVAFELCELRSDIEVTATDPAEGMLAQAKHKHESKRANRLKRISFVQADARKLPYPDNTFDAVTISWGIRNIKPFEEALHEMLRVVKPGAGLFILESGKPELRAVKLFYRFYSKLLPTIGEKISKFRPAYQYYTQSVDGFPSGSAFVARLHELGVAKPRVEALAGGIVYLYSGNKPL